METYTIAHITLTQLVFYLLAVLAVFLGKYNKLSDQLEATEQSIYPFGKFLKYNWANALYYIISGATLLGVANEIGLEGLKHFITIPDIGEKVADITIAVMSGIYGHKLIDKFIKG